MFKNILMETEGDICKITINRAERSNALTYSTRHELINAIQIAKFSAEIKAVVIGGTGVKAFCAGQDLVEAKQDETGTELRNSGYALFNELRNFEKPLIGAINGTAMGAGMQVAMLTDYSIFAENAKMGMTEINVGIPCIFGSFFLANLIGPRKTMDYVQTGRLITAKEALDMGIVNEVVPFEQVWDRAMEIAEKFAQKPQAAYRWHKKFLAALSQDNFDLAKKYAKDSYNEAYSLREPQECIQRFFEKKNSQKIS
jgi:enoyl-CoA hydratase/carnithine racemase